MGNVLGMDLKLRRRLQEQGPGWIRFALHRFSAD